jgi:hypothetical protein
MALSETVPEVDVDVFAGHHLKSPRPPHPDHTEIA